MSNEKRDRLDRLLELLTEEVADRLRRGQEGEERGTPTVQASSQQALVKPMQGDDPARAADTGVNDVSPGTPSEPPSPTGLEADAPPDSQEALGETATGAEAGSETEPVPATDRQPPAPPTSHTARFLGRLALGLMILVVVINIPFNRHGTTLATVMPDRRALVIRDGLVVTEEDDPEIYIYEDGRFRWISSLKAFEMKGYTWGDVHVVEDGFLETYEIGPPIHVIVKCHDSPHIYRIEEEKKRWIVDIGAFEEAGYVWEDVEFVACEYLRSLPDGETIPPGEGPAPQP